MRPVAPGHSSGVTLLVAGALVVAAYAIILPVTATATLPTAGAIPLAFAMALIGLFVCVTGRDVLGHVLGFLVFENGIFGLALLATYGLPGIVEAGRLSRRPRDRAPHGRRGRCRSGASTIRSTWTGLRELRG